MIRRIKIRYQRYLIFILRIYLYEKPRGLDFYARDLTLCKNSNGKYHGYSVSPKKYLNKIFSSIDISDENVFLDIGCGKGYVLTFAAKYPFKEIEGFDISASLIQIAQKNISILNLINRIKVFTSDALQYDNYEKFDHFFLFNPFPSDIMRPTIWKIIESIKKRPRKITVIYYNPTCHKDFIETGHFEVVKELYDNIKDYKTYIYKSI
jgi:SAM-dependent methyltransferase